MPKTKSTSSGATAKKGSVKKKKLIPVPKLKKKCHEAWSELVRLRDGKCMLCGNTDHLAAHHFIVSSARSLQSRFDPSNGIALCYGCHIHKVHKEASLRITTLCRDALLESGAITVQDVLRVMNTVSDASDIKRDDLDTILAALQFQIAEMKAAKAVTNDTKEEIKP